MKTRLQHDFVMDSFKVWCYIPGDTIGKSRLLRLIDNQWRWDEVDPNVEQEPTMVLPSEVLEGIVAEAGSHLPPSAATDRHLYDAIGVRDRLLALVEKRQ